MPTISRIHQGHSAGFTVVEMLIVIVVIAILAAIVIISYNGVVNKAHDTAVASDLQHIYEDIEVWVLNENEGVYPKTSAELEVVDLSVSTGSYDTETYGWNLIYCPPYPYNTSKEIALLALSKSGKTFIHNQRGIAEYTGPQSMGDYVDLCLDILDTERKFNYGGDNNRYRDDPNLWITCPAYSTYAGGWRRWVGGEYASTCPPMF